MHPSKQKRDEEQIEELDKLPPKSHILGAIGSKLTDLELAKEALSK
jgi:hypothetical protein